MTVKKAAPRAPRKGAPSAQARQAEATTGYMSLEIRGITLRIPVGGNMPLAVIDAIEEGASQYKVSKLLIGAEQWQSLLDAGATRDDLGTLAEKLNAASGNF